jgi:prophage regulatory protein
MSKENQFQLPPTGYVRLPAILAVYPVSRATWWNMVKAGKAPAAVKLGPRITAWRVSDIRKMLGDAA